MVDICGKDGGLRWGGPDAMAGAACDAARPYICIGSNANRRPLSTTSTRDPSYGPALNSAKACARLLQAFPHDR